MKQDITKRSSEYTRKEENPNIAIAMRMDYENGAEWGSAFVVEKAIQWLKENIDNYTSQIPLENSGYNKTVLSPDFDETFKKAMLGV